MTYFTFCEKGIIPPV